MQNFLLAFLEDEEEIGIASVNVILPVDEWPTTEE